MDPRSFAQSRKLTGCLEDQRVKMPYTKVLGEAVLIPVVALRATGHLDPRKQDLVHVTAQRLAEPSSLKALFDDKALGGEAATGS